MKLFALAFLLLIAAIPAQAQDQDARLQILKGQIEGFLDNQKAMAQRNGCRLDAKGEITTEKAAGYYALTLPAMTYTDAKGIRTEIGMVSINAVPQGTDEWKVSFALPSPINSYSKAGAAQFRTDIGSQKASGIWSERLGHFTSVNATLDNVRLNNLDDQGTVTIGGATFTQQLTAKDSDAYTGNAALTLNNISAFEAETQFKGNLPKITMATNIADRAAQTPMTREQIKNRAQAGRHDAFNVFAFLFGAPERVEAKVTGLDALSGQLQQSMLTASPSLRPKYLQSILAVSAVSGMGRAVPGDTSSKSYDVVFGPNGSMTLNGTDFGIMMQTTTQGNGIPVLR